MTSRYSDSYSFIKLEGCIILSPSCLAVNSILYLFKSVPTISCTTGLVAVINSPAPPHQPLSITGGTLYHIHHAPNCIRLTSSCVLRTGRFYTQVTRLQSLQTKLHRDLQNIDSVATGDHTRQRAMSRLLFRPVCVLISTSDATQTQTFA